MAIDTRAKRASTMALLNITHTYWPSGGLDQAGRAAVTYSYSGNYSGGEGGHLGVKHFPFLIPLMSLLRIMF